MQWGMLYSQDNENTGIIMIATVQTPGGVITYEGNTSIDGVPGTSAPVKLSFLNAAGAKTGKLLPTGNITDNIDGVIVSCIDVAVPMVIVSAKSMNKTGYETKQELDNNKEFMKAIEKLRQAAGMKMGLGHISNSISPKICLVSPARERRFTQLCQPNQSSIFNLPSK